MIARLIKNEIQKTSKSILILGPRQVGKSTLIRSLEPDLILNLADNATFIEFQQKPNELRQRLSELKPKTVLIDEVQMAPELLNTVQSILDEEPIGEKTKFYLTGSSARKLKRGRANLLPGRIFSYELGPLCAAELDYKLDSKKALAFGTLPEAYLSDQVDSKKLLETYSGVYLKEEIQAEALTRNLQGFSRFILEAAHSASQALDFSKIARKAKIERKLASRFFEILEDTMIAYKVDVFDKTEADIVKRPKFYFFDPGVLNGLLSNFNVSEDRKGSLFEHLVVSQIVSSAKAKDKKISLTYFRTKGGFEVDFVLEIEGEFYAIEAKSGKVSEQDVSKLERFEKHFKGVKRFFALNLEPGPKKINKTTVCDLNYFLKEVGL